MQPGDDKKTETQIHKPDAPKAPADAKDKKVPEIGGRQGPEPTRYGDWESSGRCVDF